MEKTTQKKANEHILLTSLGMNAIPTDYEWNGKTVNAPLTPLALVQLLDKSQQPSRVVAMVTNRAKTATWLDFETGINNTLGFKPQSVSIPDGRNSDEIRAILETVAQKIPKGAELTLDVTQGFRHFPFIFYALVLYLTSLRGVKIRGAYYGMIETPANLKPIIDLQPLLELPEWFHAVRMFRDQGTTLPMAQLLKPLANKLGKKATLLFKNGNNKGGGLKRAQAKKVESAVDYLEKYAFAYESALPLELGKAGHLLSDAICKLPTISPADLPPLIGELTNAIASVSDDVAFVNPPAKKGQWKTNVILDKDELARQADMIDLYLERGQFPLAAGLMREWVVSWAILKSGNPKEIGKWLNRKARSRYERRLGALDAFARDTAFKAIRTNAQKAFGDFWNQLADLRNTLHHHGMRYDPLEQPPPKLKSVQKFWDQLKAGYIALPQLGGGGGRLLLSPQGTRPGVLFSALKVAQPDTCLVICSGTSVSSISDAAKHAGFGNHIEQTELNDPHGGFDEIDTAVAKARPHLLNADKIVANMTGGTTLMGLVIQRLVEEAQKLDRPVRRFALIDRRPPYAQNSNPYVVGNAHWLDA